VEHDLRAEGVVVEPLHGSTTCPAGSPSPAPHRAGGSACWPATSWPTAGSPHRRLHDETVLVTGHSYVDPPICAAAALSMIISSSTQNWVL
jgi:hypothetical protein